MSTRSWLDNLEILPNGFPVKPDGIAPGDTVTLCGERLTISDVVRIARGGVPVRLTEDPETLRRIQCSCRFLEDAVRAGNRIYGVNTGFGAMAGVVVPDEQSAELQRSLIWFLKSGAGPQLPKADVRAAMVLRANSHMRGASGVRHELIQRLAVFLNARVTPCVREFGSIGASGDLVPLASIAGALIGLDPAFTVDFDGEQLGAPAALARLGLPPLELRPKEGLAMVNGTSAMTGIAANCVYDCRILLRLVLGAHALLIQALHGTDQSLAAFIHACKPHAGQVWAAARMRELLAGSRLIRADGEEVNGEPPQDRYSLRCLPQYLGPIVEGFEQIARQVEIEMNSATDNPLIDVEAATMFHGGNFLGQYIGVAMDHLRYYMALLAKHLDVQIALLVAPEFNNGLPASLVGNPSRRINTGLKGLQIAGNSLIPLLEFYGNSLADRFPTHAEQFNQNISSQGFGSANLTRHAIAIFQQYVAIALIFGVQGVDLRTYVCAGHYNTEPYLSPATRKLYRAIRIMTGNHTSSDRPYLSNDGEQDLESDIHRLAADIAAGGLISNSLSDDLSLSRSCTTK